MWPEVDCAMHCGTLEKLHHGNKLFNRTDHPKFEITPRQSRMLRNRTEHSVAEPDEMEDMEADVVIALYSIHCFQLSVQHSEY